MSTRFPRVATEGGVESAVLLAAGFGTRLRPLTEQIPKALMPVGNRPILDWQLDALARAGVRRVIVNASHLADRLDAELTIRSSPELEIVVSREAEPLGTGGGLHRVRRLLAEERAFFVINADAFHDVDLVELARHHDARGADATVVLHRVDEGQGDELSIDAEGNVTGVPGGSPLTAVRRWHFTGLHVLTPRILRSLPRRGSIFAGYRELLRAGARVSAFELGPDRTAIDIGTPRGYLSANFVAAGTAPAVLVDPRAELAPGCSIGPRAVIGEGAVLGERCHVANSVVMPSTVVAADSHLTDCVAYPGGSLRVPRG